MNYGLLNLLILLKAVDLIFTSFKAEIEKVAFLSPNDRTAVKFYYMFLVLLVRDLCLRFHNNLAVVVFSYRSSNSITTLDCQVNTSFAIMSDYDYFSVYFICSQGIYGLSKPPYCICILLHFVFIYLFCIIFQHNNISFTSELGCVIMSFDSDIRKCHIFQYIVWA